MRTFAKILNAIGMIAGCVAVFFGITFLLHHQYAIYSARRQHWIPTIVVVLIGLWLFFVGLFGFIRSKGRA
ncbi:MAG TPA: hypothetical protein VK709_02680 [Candidatus Saccharimonadales bacterium]|jgi:hypothetical protein|nr:hypothetical protein [Candidatus Saccharimonadales bacterium]